MDANHNAQLSGGCKGFPGASEQKYFVSGQTFRYRRYLYSIGLSWDVSEYGWKGRLSEGRVWYLSEKLGLEVVPAEPNTAAPYRPGGNLPTEPVKVGRAPKRPRKVDGQETRWEEYSAMTARTRRDAGVREGRNINERKCFWGCELCSGCMECVSNIDENGDEPDAGFASWNDDEENERNNATMPVS